MDRFVDAYEHLYWHTSYW